MLLIASLLVLTTPLAFAAWNSSVNYSVTATYDNNRAIVGSNFSATGRARFYKGGTFSRDAVYTFIIGVSTTEVTAFSQWTGNNNKTYSQLVTGSSLADIRVHGDLWVGTQLTKHEAKAMRGLNWQGQRWMGR